MGQAQHFEQGSNWKAKNAASIKLRAGDGKNHPVSESRVESSMTLAERERALARREQERTRIEKARQARDRGARRDTEMDAKHASGDHTPAGWVPANRRGFVDPLTRAADPRPSAPISKRRRADAAVDASCSGRVTLSGQLEGSMLVRSMSPSRPNRRSQLGWYVAAECRRPVRSPATTMSA